MTEAKQLPTRNEVPEELTWDLTKIYADDQAFEVACEEISTLINEVTVLAGTLKNGPEALLAAIEALLRVSSAAETIYTYSHLKNDQDTSNGTYQAMHAKASSIITQVSESVSWFEPELLTMTDEEINAYIDAEPKLTVYKHYLEELLSTREHVLSSEQETLLAAAGEIFGAAGNTFSVLNNADLKFPVITNEQGEKVQLSHGVYGQLLESSNREVRKSAYDNLYQVYKQFQNTFASTLSTNIKTHNFRAKVRNYSSAREAALSANHIPESVYDTLVSVVNEKLPLLHRYITLRKKMLKIDDLSMYDLYTPILGDAPLQYSYEEAVTVSQEALQPLGEDYLNIVKEAYNNRWIDVVENQGKRSGAYSSGCYQTAPYILMNWHDSLDQLYTLVHEMGHSVHSYYTRNNQPYIYGDYSIFLAEIASTTNENILTEYLLEKETDPKIRASILNRYLDGFKGTIFRQTQFAEFEHFMHEADAKGTPLTSDYLSKNYAELNKKYYGPDVNTDENIASEWSRIPHFYYNYYVYQYATGFSAASALAKKIIANEPGALEAYLNYLKSGSSDYPIEVMKKAGVDMTKPDYIIDAFKVFEKRLTELEELVEQL